MSGAPDTPLRVISQTLGSDDMARAVLGALSAAGYACVPRVPSTKMLYEASFYVLNENGEDAWRSMVETAETEAADT